MFNMKDAIAQLELIFDKANEKYFGNELPRPIITIQLGKGNAYGWCTSREAWVNDDDDKKYFEINVCAEYLNRSIEELCATIIHEMVHLKNSVDDIKDCNGKYHNGKFRDAAEKIGMIVEKTTYGYSYTSLSEEQIEFVHSLGLKSFGFKRILPDKKKSKKTGYKHECPVCGASFWSSRMLNVHCEYCDESFEIVNQ